MEIKKVVSYIIVALVFFAVGGGTGFLSYESFKKQQPLEETPVYKILTSNLIPTITAYGRISSINGNDMVLSNGEELLNIKMENSAPVYVFDSSVDLGNGLSAPSQKVAGIDILKEGQDISVNLEINKDGQINGVAGVLLSK